MSGRRGTREGPLTQPGCSRARILAGLHLRAASRVPRQRLLSPDPTLRLPMGAAGQLLDSLWPLPKCPLRPNLVVATWLCKKLLGTAIRDLESQEEARCGSRRCQGAYGGLGQETNI